MANITLDNDFIYYSVPEIIEMILTKYKRNIILDIVFMNKELKEVIKDLNGKITSVVYVWKKPLCVTAHKIEGQPQVLSPSTLFETGSQC